MIPRKHSVQSQNLARADANEYIMLRDELNRVSTTEERDPETRGGGGSNRPR